MLYLQDRDETETLNPQDRDETEMFDFSKLSRPRRSTFKTETRRSKKRLETASRRDVQDRDYIPGARVSVMVTDRVRVSDSIALMRCAAKTEENRVMVRVWTAVLNECQNIFNISPRNRYMLMLSRHQAPHSWTFQLPISLLALLLLCCFYSGSMRTIYSTT